LNGLERFELIKRFEGDGLQAVRKCAGKRAASATEGRIAFTNFLNEKGLLNRAALLIFRDFIYSVAVVVRP
jgi:hypothetical protein